MHLGGGAEVQYIYQRLLEKLPTSSNILIVGVMGGRDYFFFKSLGHKVHAVDIGAQPFIEPITICNVEDSLPFQDEYFDAVIIGEVLEHLKFDVRALENLRRVLKPTGRLVVSIPFFNDWEEGHMRIHSPISGHRLLSLTGFGVIDYLERPGIAWPRGLNFISHAYNSLVYMLTGKTAYDFTVKTFSRIEWHLGHLQWPRSARRMSKHFGGYFLCEKIVEVDHLKINRDLYTSDVG